MGHALIPTCNEHVGRKYHTYFAKSCTGHKFFNFYPDSRYFQPGGEISVSVSHFCIFQKETKGKVVIKDEGHLKMDFFASCEPNYF